MKAGGKKFMRLNPCSCGGWSQRIWQAALKINAKFVLILVLVEDGLRGLRVYNYDLRLIAS